MGASPTHLLSAGSRSVIITFALWAGANGHHPGQNQEPVRCGPFWTCDRNPWPGKNRDGDHNTMDPSISIPGLTRQSTGDTQGRVLSILAGNRNGLPTPLIPDPGATFGRPVQLLRAPAGPGSKSPPVPMGPSTTPACTNKLRRIHRYSQPALARERRIERPSTAVRLRFLAPGSLWAAIRTLGSIQPARTARKPLVRTAGLPADLPPGEVLIALLPNRSNDEGSR